ncbi:hypothetical protein FE257_002576 [Aspergillus nanangensis]|uniref:FAD-binding FR-type domain-containing protein n=1 Tax=Aspergillus nanangensis TaxID=2582783 RepID=A0AAD4CT16_ASPNN|nr:hypothetical protein FE257_002576 [Aspergillus nanangensis]
MKSRISPYRFLRFDLSSSPFLTRHASSSTASASAASSAPKQRRWLRLACVSVAAAGIGAYIRFQQSPGSSTTLNPYTFTPYYLVSREPVSSSGSLFTLQPPRPDIDNHQVYEEAWKTGVWSVMFKQPQLQIGRDYTPLPSTSEEEAHSLRFFIRKDPFGEVSRYLHSLELGTPIEVRGPKIECEIPSNTQQILFIAGGTGIAPALQAGHTLLRRTDPTHQPRIHILWANRRRQDCAGGISDAAAVAAAVTTKPWYSRLFKPSTSTHVTTPLEDSGDIPPPSLMVREIESLKSQYPGQITVDYYVDEEKTFIGKEDILKFTGSSGSPQRNMILVSGPEGFISYMVGPKLWAQGMELQGPLRGMIAELGLNDWAVWKL